MKICGESVINRGVAGIVVKGVSGKRNPSGTSAAVTAPETPATVNAKPVPVQDLVSL